MSRQEILDDPSSAFPQLHQFVAGYLHEDWVVDHERWQDAADEFIAESPRSVVLDCAAELRDLLAAGFSDAELATVVDRLGGSVDPDALQLRSDEWLQAVLRHLIDAG
jgi:CdiI immunity protein